MTDERIHGTSHPALGSQDTGFDSMQDDELINLLHNPATEDLGAERIFRRYEPICLGAAAHWTTDDQLKFEFANDVISSFIEQETDPIRASFRSGSSIAAYLRSSIRYRFIDHFRRQKREGAYTAVSIDESVVLESMPSGEMLAADRFIVSEQLAIIRRCLPRLLPDEERILTLRYLDDLTLQQIADDLDVVPSTVQSRVHKALRHLRQLLEEAGVRGVFHAGNE